MITNSYETQNFQDCYKSTQPMLREDLFFNINPDIPVKKKPAQMLKCKLKN